LSERGVAVQTFKKGPDYIDPMWLSAASGRATYNLDPHLTPQPSLRSFFADHLGEASLAWVEGNHGLFDGLALDGSNSNAALAHQLGLPVLLVIDVRGMTRGVAPLLLGYQAFDRKLKIGGVILNRVGGSRHEAKLRSVIEHYTDLPVIGAVAEDPRLAVLERHLGLVPCVELGDTRERVQRIGHIVGSQVDLDKVQEVAASAAAWRLTAASRTSKASANPAHGPLVRIGVARDRAFGFYYPDDLQALQRAGAQLVFFDTLHDARLPAVDALFIGGGFPEACLDELQANTNLRCEIRQALEAGMPAYAECGGLMYLSRSIRWKGRCAQMVGVIPADAVMHERPVGRGYVELQATAAMPWPDAAVAQASTPTVHGHEFHHSTLENLDPTLPFAWRVLRGHGIDGEHDGLLVHNLLASYAHLRSAAGTPWAQRFVAFVRRHCRETAQGVTMKPGAVASDAAAPGIATRR
jgi:cobyrinic acid a,c-diamide synthase